MDYIKTYNSLINSHSKKILMITKDDCILCEKAKKLLKEYNLEYISYNYSKLEDEDSKNNYNLKNHMKEETKGKYFPFIYIDCQYIGGFLELDNMITDGRLSELLFNKNMLIFENSVNKKINTLTEADFTNLEDNYDF
jgi:glutaredoxin